MAVNYPLYNILFLDIETVSQEPDFENLSPQWQELWTVKADRINRNREEETPATLYKKAGIYAEFGKIICISCGVLQQQNDERFLVLKSFYGNDEKDLLLRFSEMLDKWGNEPNRYLCAHNGKEFDFPYLCRRLLINNLPISSLLQLTGKKPWEVMHIDTMELWKFGDFKSYTSLNLLAHVLGVTTSKDDIDGSQVGEVYWEEKNLERIVTYCQKDVITLTQLFLRLQSQPSIQSNNIQIKA